MISRSLSALFILFIRVYQLAFSPLISALAPSVRCRFYPSCSEYGRLSFQQHGFLKGLTLTTSRLLKCHPFHPGGNDPVPHSFPLFKQNKH